MGKNTRELRIGDVVRTRPRPAGRVVMMGWDGARGRAWETKRETRKIWEI